MKKLEKDLTYDVCIVNACKCIHVLTSLGCSQGSMSKSSFLKIQLVFQCAADCQGSILAKGHMELRNFCFEKRSV